MYALLAAGGVRFYELPGTTPREGVIARWLKLAPYPCCPAASGAAAAALVHRSAYELNASHYKVAVAAWVIGCGAAVGARRGAVA